ncbi:DUF6227 family protein [Streptomyces cacaoi]|uniref:Uncharacterized protein n=1 Tax=Streptomyces cacaoi TaxID=1898 RepID=A0A4Y3QSF1_STRCI|nr:DUF6227 family protein [Streptomyces cacaoi]NNG85209.1 hypothetical protein [Streptomyces cacaoi]GEB47627.1 hypothetical protein SCA03_01780 [Streptomyces cacaoi]
MSEGEHLTPAHHVGELLARARNPFDVPDALLRRLDSALMVQVELAGWRHRNNPRPALRCSSFRHAFLLADGGSAVLWELCYDDPEHGGELREVYADEAELRRAEQRVHRRMGGGPRTGPGSTASGEPAARRGPAEPRSSCGHLSAPDTTAQGAHTYTGEDSPDHARRLLRRAENPDRPGEDVRRRLATALGHDIVYVPRPSAWESRGRVWCSVYQHAFLLADGSEISLYELEHNLSGSGRLVCEVYLEETVADEAVLRMARERGIDL